MVVSCAESGGVVGCYDEVDAARAKYIIKESCGVCEATKNYNCNKHSEIQQN